MRFVLIFASISLLCGGIVTFDLKCEFTKPNWIHGDGDACKVSELEIRGANQTVTAVNGGNKKYRDTKAIWIHNQTVFYLPTKLEKFFPNIEIVHVTNSSLKAIERNDLKPFSKLRKLILRDNDLVNLESNLFMNNSKLRLIDFSNNKLKYAGPYILQPLNNLKKAYFSSNDCIDKAMTNETEITALTNDLASKCSKRAPGKASPIAPVRHS